MHALFRFLFLLVLPTLICSAANIQSGPVITHLSAREAKIWVQWDKTPTDAELSYFNPVEPETIFKASASLGPQGIVNYTLDNVNPGRTYIYSITEDDRELKKEIFTSPIHYKDIQQPPAFTVAVLGNHYVSEKGAEPPYQILGNGYSVFPELLTKEISGAIWAGSSSFLRDMDATSYSGMMRRYGHNRAHDSTDEFFARIWHKATTGSGHFTAQHASPTRTPKTWARTAFSHYWPSASEFHMSSPQMSPLYYSFRWVDTEFFFLDTFSERSGYHERTRQPSLISNEQMDWLIGSLTESDATFKIIVSGTAMVAPTKDQSNFAFADEQHEVFMRKLERNRISGLVFISGGKPFGELTKFLRPRGYSLFELSVGSTTYQSPEFEQENNFFREPLTYSAEPQYGLVSVSGDEGNRVLSISLIESAGRTVFAKQISQQDVTWDEDTL